MRRKAGLDYHYSGRRQFVPWFDLTSQAVTAAGPSTSQEHPDVSSSHRCPTFIDTYAGVPPGGAVSRRRLSAGRRYAARYPGGGYPYPGGRSPTGSGIPIPRRSKGKTTDAKTTTEPTNTMSGIVKQLNETSISIVAQDTRTITAKLSDKTKFLNKGAAATAANFSVGDHVRIDATQDNEGFYHAMTVALEKKGTTADQETIEVGAPRPFRGRRTSRMSVLFFVATRLPQLPSPLLTRRSPRRLRLLQRNPSRSLRGNRPLASSTQLRIVTMRKIPGHRFFIAGKRYAASRLPGRRPA